jgi:DeoR/GlpR family transcriptional regulator of sugar metabolism
VKSRLIESAEAVYVLADAGKLGWVGAHWWTPLREWWTLITDVAATSEQLVPLRRLPGVTVIVAA